LADSQVLRWIDELNGVVDGDRVAREIKEEIRTLRRAPNTASNRRNIKKLYARLDNVQFKPDYMCLIIDSVKDYYRACRGFSINGVSYKRLLGTNGGIKNNTIVFVSERLWPELSRRIDNGRDMTKELVPAKLEAYKALACSASTPVSMPNGILVVKDCQTKFVEDIIYLTDENEGEPLMEFRPGTEIELDASDGFGLMLPSLAERWSEELGLDYVVAGLNSRLSWEKGMVYTFDFLDFAENVAGTYMVEDVWGNMVDIRTVELIFTESMLKLWFSYESIDDYLNNCSENNYSFCVTKVCPKELENERSTNYQFIQGYELTDEDIEELIAPTMQTTHDVLGSDWAMTVLFLAGSGISEDNAERIGGDLVTAVMIDHRVLDDPYVRKSIYQLIQNKIDEAKVGVLKVHGNYSILSGDPYALCQSIFGMPVTGLLKAGEIYNRYWVDAGSEDLVCFRAPMTSHNNVRLVHPCHSDAAAYWFRYMNTCTILNAFDTITAALNGADYDGDLIFITDNPVLVKKHKVTPTIMCVQRGAQKKVVTEDDIIQSNIASFGNDIGRITNWATSMFEVRARFEPDSAEYKELTYRIQCGQQFQQNEIDKSKGIISKPAPQNWHDRHAVNQMQDDVQKRFYRSIVADKKPYFMRYIYPDLMKEYNTYLKNTNRTARINFDMPVQDLMAIPENQRTQAQSDFLRYYDYRMPVGTADCVVNHICQRFEGTFDGYVGKYSKTNRDFDSSILKSDVSYSYRTKNAIQKLYVEYNARIRRYISFAKAEKTSDDERKISLSNLKEEFWRDCLNVCQNSQELCNILIDICYRKTSSRSFVWLMCGRIIIQNLLERNGSRIEYPHKDCDGDIFYGGERYSINSKIIEVVE